MKKRRTASGTGPLSRYAVDFGQHLEGRGYAPDSVRWRLRQLATLDRWLREHRLSAGDLDAACVNRLVTARRAAGRATLVSVANFSVPIAYLRVIAVVPPQAASQPDPVTQVLEQYRRYLVSERGLVESSIRVNLLVAESFCRTRDRGLEELSAAEVTAYVVEISARSSIGWSKKTVTGLASFLRFLHIVGVTDRPLAAALPKVAGHRRTVPCELDESDFERLLGGCDCSRDVGIRDCAILTVLWRLGLRRAEVAGLRVDDIDWRRGEITIRGKGNCHELLPMPIDVGAAIVRYLQDGHRRVPPGCRTLFVQVRAPEGAMTPGGVGDVVTKVSVRVGLPAISAHRLRHGTATQLILNGASWPEIAQLMRHRTIAVTASYATVAPALTSELARPWPGAL
ncbi:tyrosine-type recombinase/integrase [Rhodococcus sp. H29-C3]|uniref:tyrosine-type recombinase/integrase n=1 Tax=Rhodococcus sp. H29-C3 TaxID=3046307 RepID=UPI0024BB63D3|nr:tyrosine-type recombinase/integrase [Rhodococcus sp. H29-C3]MDJ0362263.1 tyrosine-type recombinase/integrase [Rhodococcus sp. H29-C3]